MKILVTGGAGFIGSNLVENLLKNDDVTHVRVIDDLSTGYYSNIEPFLADPKFSFIQEDICNYEKMLEHTAGFDVISHQAALGSVPRSIADPLRSNMVNVGGTLNILHAAVQNKVKRVVLACSSSTYGDSRELPKVEDRIGKPLSPYAVTKYAVELYADVFSQTYGLDYVGLRYFNVFGPKQNPNNPYAAVIPLFCKAFINNESPTINGDGLVSRDFTFIDNAIQANLLAMFTTDAAALNTVYNVACGERTTLLEMIGCLREISGKDIPAVHRDARAGDIAHSLADISKISRQLSYQPKVLFKEGLAKVYAWYSAHIAELN